MSKKILSVVLALVLVMSASFTAFAASVGYEEEDTTNTQEWALSEPVDNGDGTWTVEVSLKANYPVGGIQFTIENTDNEKVVLSNAVAGAGIPDNWKASVTKSNTTGKVAINPKPTDDAVDAITFGNETDGYTAKVVAILTYTVAEGGSSKINIKNDPKTATTPGGTLIAARMANGNVVTDADSPIVGQKVTSVGATRNIGSAAQAEPADIAVADAYASSGIIIDTNKFASLGYAGVVYGFSDLPGNGATNVTANYYTTRLVATNGGSLEIVKTPYVARPSRYGTGATIKVYNADGSLSKTYVIVILGDVDGSGNILVSDAILASDVFDEVATITDIQRMAANVVENPRGSDAAKAAYLYDLIVKDATTISDESDAAGTVISQSKLATAHNTYNTYYQ